MTNTTSQLEKGEILSYLTENMGRPIYVVEGKNIILSLTYLGKNKFQSEVYIPGSENSVTKEIESDFLKTINYWKPTHQFYTSFGMKVLLDSWEVGSPSA